MIYFFGVIKQSIWVFFFFVLVLVFCSFFYEYLATLTLYRRAHERSLASPVVSLKGQCTQKSSFTQPQVDPNLYECVCSEHKGRYSEESV